MSRSVAEAQRATAGGFSRRACPWSRRRFTPDFHVHARDRSSPIARLGGGLSAEVSRAGWVARADVGAVYGRCRSEAQDTHDIWGAVSESWCS